MTVAKVWFATLVLVVAAAIQATLSNHTPTEPAPTLLNSGLFGFTCGFALGRWLHFYNDGPMLLLCCWFLFSTYS